MTRLLPALDEDDFAVERFEYVEQLERGLLALQRRAVEQRLTSPSATSAVGTRCSGLGGFLTPA